MRSPVNTICMGLAASNGWPFIGGGPGRETLGSPSFADHDTNRRAVSGTAADIESRRRDPVPVEDERPWVAIRNGRSSRSNGTDRDRFMSADEARTTASSQHRCEPAGSLRPRPPAMSLRITNNGFGTKGVNGISFAIAMGWSRRHFVWVEERRTRSDRSLRVRPLRSSLFALRPSRLTTTPALFVRGKSKARAEVISGPWLICTRHRAV